MSSEPQMAALPVRARGTLEIIDTAFKLYRRYFGVLMAWSAIVAVLIVLVSLVPFAVLFVYPFVVGSCACCIAAAVRGQKMSFGQVWEFTKPRYGALLLLGLIAVLLVGAASGVSFFITTLFTLAGAWVLTSINVPDIVSAWLGGIGTLISFLLGSVVGAMLYVWIGLSLLVACLEDDKRSSQAIGRAFELIQGNWRHVMALSALLALAIIALLGIVGGSLALFGSGIGALSANPTDTIMALFGFSLLGFIGVFSLFWSPIQNLILAVLYLDLRVRKEALDLEWSSYASAPPSAAPAASEPPATQTSPDVAASASPFAGNDATSAAEGVTAPTVRPPTAATPEVADRPVVLTKPPSPAPPSSAPAEEFDSSSSFSAGGAGANRSDADDVRDAP